MRKLVIMVIVAIAVSGCKSVDRSAFSHGKVYAVVVVGITPKIKSLGGTGSAKQTLPTGLKSKAIAQSTSKVADQIASQYIKGLRKYAPIKIVSGSSVTGRKVYKRFKSIDTSTISKKHVATQKYHNYWMDDFKHMPRLAKQLGVDGVLMVYLTPGYYSHGTGVDFRGRRSGIYKPVVETFVDAYSAAGKRVVRYNLRYSPADKQAVRQDHSHYIKLNEAIASKHAYMAGIDAAKRIWGIK
jgi:uncharacterized protein YceK/uncharacterized protein YbjQ (UPF0145 family)